MGKLSILGLNAYYREFNRNRKTVVVLVHAHPLNSEMWRYQLKSLSRYRLILPDMIGYGQTHFLEMPSPKTVYLPQQALFLRLLLDSIGVYQAHLIGLSMGGEIITEFARLFPDSVLSLTLCANIPRGETNQSAKKRRELAAEIEIRGMKDFAEQNIARFINIQKYPPESRLYRKIYQIMVESPCEGAAAYTRGRADRRDNVPFLKNFKKPVLVMAGGKDSLFTVEEMQEMAKLIFKGEFQLLAECGHLLNLEDPKGFNQILLNFLEKKFNGQ